MHRKSMPGFIRGVPGAVMRQMVVKQDCTASCHFNGHGTALRPGRVIERLNDEFPIGPLEVSLLERHLVPAGDELHAAVFKRRIFDGKPETGAGLGLGIDKCRILVAGHLAANTRGFEYVHRLEDAGILVTQALHNCAQPRRAGERVKHGVEVVHRMTHLVEALVFRLAQITFFIEGAILEEKADFVAGIVEILVVQLRLLRRGKDGAHRFRVECVNELAGALLQASAVSLRDKILDDYNAGRFERSHLGLGKPAVIARLECRNTADSPVPC